MRTNSPFFHSTVWKGPEPMIGGSFLNLFSTSEGSTLLQMCSGSMGTQRASMFAFGFEQVNTTVVSSGASTLSMNLT
ncbi:MAG: hypothetical protein BWY94_01902 [Actinobacteria bacterium ADurb.BinA094]|nr:MAG: hypothetical protein BWY94_01902 [Actinobacteria bacterium ADurb.BinA094]